MVTYKRLDGFTGYLPYFYEAGRYVISPVSADTALGNIYKQPSGGYNFSSDTPIYWKPQTVEQVIQRGYLAIPNTEPETAILTDKQQTFWQGLDDIIRQVRKRYEIYNKHIYQLEQGKCYAISAKYQVEAYRGGAPADSKEIYKLGKQLRELYEQERMERVDLWRDVSKLRQQLPETAQQYLSAHRRVSILYDAGSDRL